MSNEVSNDMIYEAILQMKGDVGGLIARVDLNQFHFLEHIKADTIMATDISNIRMSQAKTRGAVKVWGLVATFAAAVASAAGSFLRH